MTTPSPFRDPAAMDALCNLACGRLEELFGALGVRARRYGRRYIGRCPVHGGDNPSAFSLYHEAERTRGNWSCQTHHCHRAVSGSDRPTASLIALVRGIISHQEHGWRQPGDRLVSHAVAVERICTILKLDPATLPAVPVRKSPPRPTTPPAETALCSPEQLGRMLEIPAAYYIERGFREETLREFGVGLCVAKRSEAYGRIVIPVWNPSGGKIIGVLTRSVLPKCPECKLCHEPPCPEVRKPYLRWFTIGKFSDKNHLYGLWKARDAIRTSRTAVLVEGAADLWRLWEAGVRNVVGLFGSQMTARQEVLLQETLCQRLVVLTDDDDAGNHAASEIARRCGVWARVDRVLPIGASDVGDMSVERILSETIPMIRSRESK